MRIPGLKTESHYKETLNQFRCQTIVSACVVSKSLLYRVDFCSAHSGSGCGIKAKPTLRSGQKLLMYSSLSYSLEFVLCCVCAVSKILI